MKKLLKSILPSFIVNFIKSKILHLKLLKVEKNYNNVISNIRAKNDKIRVAFLVSEISKWQYQSLYEVMLKSSKYEPFVLVTPFTSVHNNIDKTRIELKPTFEFFKNMGLNVYYAYNIEKKVYIDLNCFSPDLVFYQQPWDIDETQDVYNVSKFALTFESPYYVQGTYYLLMESHFYALKAYFIASDNDKTLMEQFYSAKNLVVTGHPKIENALNIITNNKRFDFKKTIIYAPHHSFTKETFNWGTFTWSGNAVLALAKKYPQYNWVLKPHPRLKFALQKYNIMTKEEIDDFYSQWLKNGVINETGNYFDLFASSDLMITDCGSFITEYFLTKKPMIHLTSKYGEPHSLMNQEIISVSYQADNAKQLNNIFEELIVKSSDTKAKDRDVLFEKFNFLKSTENILKYIDTILKK